MKGNDCMTNWRSEYNETYSKLLSCEAKDKPKYEKKCRDLVKANFPKKLYKYSFFDKNEYWKELLLGEVFFQHPSEWNDLLDSACLIDYDNCIEELHKYNNVFEIDQLVKTNTDKRKSGDLDSVLKVLLPVNEYSDESFRGLIRKLQLAKQFTHTLKASCFTEEFDNMKMWYYYAEQYTGFCVEFDFSAQSDGNIKPVIYTEDKFTVKTGNQSFYATEFFLPMLLKNPCWQDEKEWRFIYPNKLTPDKQTIINCPLKAIYFGSKVSESDLENALRLLKNSGKQLPKLYKMVVNKYKNEFIAIEMVLLT